MSALLLMLPSEVQPVPRYRAWRPDAPGASAAWPEAVPVSALPTAAAGEPVWVVVPAERLGWHPITLPLGSLKRHWRGGWQQPARLLALVHGQLEDEWLLPPADLLCALPAPDWAQDGEPLWIATLPQAWLKLALAPLLAAGWRPDRIVPALAPQPAGQPTRLLLGGAPQAAWAACWGPGGAWQLPVNHPEDAQTVLTLAQAQAQKSGGSPPELLAEPAVLDLAQTRWHAPNVALCPPATHWAQSVGGTPWNLAQFDFAAQGRPGLLHRLAATLRQGLVAREWRLVRWGLAGLVAVQLAAIPVWSWRTQQELLAEQAQQRQLVSQTFPELRLVVDAPTQMARALDQRRQAAGELQAGDLEPLLARLGPLLPPEGLPAGVQLQFEPGQLRLRAGAALMASVGSRWTGPGHRARVDGDSLVLLGGAS